MGLAGDGVITGDPSNEVLKGGAGNDTIAGGDGDDRLVGGAGSDNLNGGAGNDFVYGDSSNDLLIYQVADNVGSADVYDGGSGSDTLRVELTRAQWLTTSVQLDVASYLQFLALNTNPVNGETTNDEFTFSSFNLTVSKIENFQIFVDGILVDLNAHAPTDLVLSNSSVDENSVSGSVVGSLSASDPDTGETFTYQLLDDAGGLFAINGYDLVVAGAIDFETAALHSVTIRVTDSTGRSYDETFDIAVNNVAGVTLVGDAANNTLLGTSEEDSLSGLAGVDSLIGGAGPDVLDGGSESDFADYRNSPIGLTVDLMNPNNNTGEALGDTYISIERIRGSAFDDVLRGDDDLVDSNFLEGGLGADILDGRAGSDYASYQRSTSGLTASLANPADNTGEAAGDVFISIENLMGSEFNDVLIGDNANNFLRGRGGADVFDGRGGIDTVDYFNSASLTIDLANAANNTGDAAGDVYTSIENARGGPGDDLIFGDASNNRLVGSGGNDIINGTVGDDTLVGEAGNDTLIGNGITTRAAYDTATGGVTVNLSTGIATGNASVGIDTLIGIARVTGSSFDDTLIGSADRNTFIAGAGNDFVDGGINSPGSDSDLLNYTTSPGAIVFNFATGTALDGFGGIDAFINIDSVFGSSFADVLIGRSGIQDFFEGRGGDDFIDGGGSLGGPWGDAASYINSATSSVFVDLNLGIGNDGLGGTDTLVGIVQVLGSAFDDVIVGNADDNGLRGFGGSDTIYGGDGNDVLIGEDSSSPAATGDDFLYGQNGDDQIFGDAGTDFISGGADDDFLTGGVGNDTFLFAEGDGNDIIADFIAGAGTDDVIDLTNVANVHTLADLLAIATQNGAHTVIDFGNGDMITLQNSILGNLSADDFWFA